MLVKTGLKNIRAKFTCQDTNMKNSSSGRFHFSRTRHHQLRTFAVIGESEEETDEKPAPIQREVVLSCPVL